MGRHPRRRRAPNRALVLATILLGALCLTPSPAVAAPPPADQAGAFTMVEGDHFRFHVQPNPTLDAAGFLAAYGLVAERGFGELSALFAAAPAAKIPVYVYADEAAWVAATAALERPELAGIDAVADPAAGDVSILLPRFLARSPLEAENQLRHATAHLLLATATGNKLPRGFAEGLAQYAERPITPKLARLAAVVQTASQGGTLLSWSDLNRDQPFAGDADLIGAQSYAVAAFLVDRYGLGTLRAFLTALQAEADWRQAMRGAYKRGPQELEDQWEEGLPRWTASGWDDNLVAAFDLQPARDLLDRADYAGAKSLLERSQRLYTDLGDNQRLAEVDGLVALCDTGLQAEALMTQTQQALELHTYDRAETLLAQAETQYAVLPETQRPTALMATYRELAVTGAEATVRLDDAQRLAHRWGSYPEARAAAVAAGTAFSRLGDEEMLTQARDILSDLDARQRRLVLMLAALVTLTLAWLALWLWARGPRELDWR